MKSFERGKKRRELLTIRHLLVVAAFVLLPVTAQANPQDGTVTEGQASLVYNGKSLDVIQTTERVLLDWRRFDIGADEITRFIQPGPSSVALNRVNGPDPSRIAGTLSANGKIILINPNGIFFTPTARIDVNGLVATSADITNSNFIAGNFVFDRRGHSDAAIINEGIITAADAGLVGLVAPHVENKGLINARLGRVILAAGDTATIDFYGDGLIQVASSDALTQTIVKNQGAIHAAGGHIQMTAAAGRNILDSLVSVKGELNAPVAEMKNGRISIRAASSKNSLHARPSNVEVHAQLDASGHNPSGTGGQIDITGDYITLFEGSSLMASGAAGGGTILVGGEYQGRDPAFPNAQRVYVNPGVHMDVSALEEGNAGRAIIWSDNNTKFYGQILARSDALAGNGGFVEVSGKEYLTYRGFVDTQAPLGLDGLLLLDPANIIIASGSGDSAADGAGTFAGNPSGTAGTIASGDTGPTTIFESELQGIAAATSVSLTATNSITINDLADNNLNLAQTAGRSVTLSAGAGGISMNAGDTITTVGGALNITTTGGGGASLGSLATSGGLITFNVAGSSIVNGTISGTGTAVTKATGTGLLELAGNNTYTGTTTITNGIIQVNTNTALGTGTISLNGGTLQDDGSARTLSNPITLAANSTLAGSGGLTFNGTMTGNNTRTITNNNTAGVTFNNINISNSATARTLTISGTGTTTVNGVIANGSTSTSALTKSGTGTVILNGANTYGGTTTLTTGILQVGTNTALGTGTISLNGGTLQDDGSARTLSNPITLAANSTLAGSGGLTFNGTMTGNNTRTITNNNTAGVTFNNINISNSATARTLTISGTGTTTVNGVIANGSTSTSALTKSGTGTVILNGANTYGGTTTLTTGILQVGTNTALGTGTISLNGGTLQDDGSARTLSNPITLAANSTLAGSGGLTFNGTMTGNNTRTITNNNTAGVTFNNINISNSATARTLTISGTGTTTVNGVIANGSTSTSALTKSGTGTVILNGANTYGGITTINDGILSVASLANGGSASGIGQSSNAAANLVLNNGTLRYTGGSVSTNRSYTITAGSTGTIDVDVAGTVLTVSGGSAATTGALTKAGAGTLLLSGAHLHTGATTVNDGILRLGAADRFADTSALVVESSGTFDLNSFSETMASITNSGLFSFGTGNTMTTTGAQIHSGRVAGGAVSFVAGSGNAITATNAANDFTGNVNVTTTGAANLVDATTLNLGTVSAGTFSARALAGNLATNGQVQTTGTTGTPLILMASGNYVNNAPLPALQTGAGGRWLVYSAAPTMDTLNGLVPNFIQRNTALSGTVYGIGNGFIYAPDIRWNFSELGRTASQAFCASAGDQTAPPGQDRRNRPISLGTGKGNSYCAVL